MSELCLRGFVFNGLKNASMGEVIRNVFDTENADWLLVMIRITHQKGAAVSITENTLVVYDNREPLALPIPSLELRQKLLEAFTDQVKQLRLSFEIPLNVRHKTLNVFLFL